MHESDSHDLYLLGSKTVCDTIGSANTDSKTLT